MTNINLTSSIERVESVKWMIKSYQTMISVVMNALKSLDIGRFDGLFYMQMVLLLCNDKKILQHFINWIITVKATFVMRIIHLNRLLFINSYFLDKWTNCGRPK